MHVPAPIALALLLVKSQMPPRPFTRFAEIFFTPPLPLQNRNTAARPRPRKVPSDRPVSKPKVFGDGSTLSGSRPKRALQAPLFLGSEELAAGGRRSARWNAGMQAGNL